MLSRSKYQQPCSAAEDAWKHTYLAQDVEALQQQKQHHLHMADKQGVRQPLNHGRDPKDPTKKNQLPKEQVAHKHAARDLSWSNTSARHALEGQAKHGWHTVGPCHDPNLYGNYPALLAALQRRMQRTLPFGNAPLAASQRGTDQPSCASW